MKPEWILQRYDANCYLLELATLKLIISFTNRGIRNMNQFSILHLKHDVNGNLLEIATLKLINHLLNQNWLRDPSFWLNYLITPTLDGAHSAALLAYGSLRSPEGFDRVTWYIKGDNGKLSGPHIKHMHTITLDEQGTPHQGSHNGVKSFLKKPY